MGLVWVACDLVTGKLGAEFQGVKCQALQRIVGAYTTTTLSLVASSLPAGWEAVTVAGRALLVASDESDGRILWGGTVTRRRRTSGTAGDNGEPPRLDLDLVTCEGYLDRRIAGDHSWSGQDQASVIAAGLLGDAADGIDLVVDAPASGTTRDRVYADSEDTTIYQRLTELMGVDGGPEFTIDLSWADIGQTTVVKTARVRDRIGVASASPEGVFEHDTANGGGLVDWEMVEDYGAGAGANSVTATSSGQGDQRPSGSASDAAKIAAGWPTYEYRYSPSSSITKASTLAAHAKKALAQMTDGRTTYALTARLDRPPLLGREWSLGDDVAYRLKDVHIDVEGIARCVGWEIDPQALTVKPILAEPGVVD